MSAFPERLQTLLRPGGYPHAVTAVELVETHVSWVLLTGEFAYKIKRPVHYAFVDLRSSERRAFLCNEEVRLNRRFAPELYLGVCPINLCDGEARIDGPGPAIEYAVKMRQFVRASALDRLLAAGGIEPAELEVFGCALARLHAQLPQPAAGQSWGRPEALRAIIADNAAQAARAATRLGALPFPSSLPPRLGAALEAALPMLSARFAAGRVRECHGDLHTGNIVRLATGLRAFDCLEFEPALRWMDVADEIAFLLADLEARHCPLHAQAFLAGYLLESGDYQACASLPLFRAHRALVRAKIVALAALERAAAGTELREPRSLAQAYLECARDALAPRSALLVLMCGLSGSGKTWLAQRLAPHLGAVQVRSDIERKRLAGLSPTAHSGSALARGLYAPAETRAVYERLGQLAAEVLAGGYSVIVDATFGRREDRAPFGALAARLDAKIIVVDCQAPLGVLSSRIRERRRRADDPSEADLEVLAWQRAHFEPIVPAEGLQVLVATTTEPHVLEQLLQRMRS